MPNEYHAERMRQKRAALKRDAEGGSADALEAIQRARELNARRQKEMRAQKRLEASQRYADLQHRTEAGDDGAKGALELMEREREELKEKWPPAPFEATPRGGAFAPPSFKFAPPPFKLGAARPRASSATRRGNDLRIRKRS
jgi:hypothetical protein